MEPDNLEDKIDSHTVALVHYKGEQVDEVDSGILLSVNGFPYLATAGHCLKKPEGQTIRIGYGQERSHPVADWSDMVGVPVFNKRIYSPIDAAFAPIRNPDRLIAHGKSFFKLPKDFPRKLELEKGTPVFILGYPDEFWEPLLDVSPGSLELSSLAYETTVISTGEHSYDYVYARHLGLPDAGGLSGSGLWTLSKEGSLKLIGINTDQVPSAEKCVAMLIEAWFFFFARALEEDRVQKILNQAFRTVQPLY